MPELQFPQLTGQKIYFHSLKTQVNALSYC